VCRTIAVSGATSRILSAACSPSRRGTCTSRRTRSGARASVSADRLYAVDARLLRNVVASSAAWEVGTLARGIAATCACAHGECDMRLRVLVSGLTFFAAAMLAAVAPFVANA
jgi:hypothetical protein